MPAPYRREYYMRIVRSWIDKPLIKVLTWVRRVWKTTLLKQIQQEFWLLDTVYINFEDLQYRSITNYESLYELLTQRIEQWAQWVFIDEVQRVEQRERVINSIHTTHPEIPLFITWSNSTLLASDLTTYLRGRYIEIPVFPFSYDEFIDYKRLDRWVDSFATYLNQWWMPVTYMFEHEHEQRQQLRWIINTIFVNDILERHHIREVKLLEDILMYSIQQTWSEMSASSLHKWIVWQWKKVSINTVTDYLRYLQEAYLLYPVEFYDIQWKKRFERKMKQYCVDHSLRNHLFSGFDEWRWKQLENIVYIAALRHGWSVSVWVNWWYEVDFILERNWKKIYLQVAYSLATSEVVEREYRSLTKIGDAFPKYVVSLDAIPQEAIQGIRNIQARNLETILD